MHIVLNYSVLFIGGAAAWAAMNWYQNKNRNEGKNVSHGFLKKLIVAFAAAKAVKYAEKNSSGFQQGLSRDIIEDATRNASIVSDIKYGDQLAGNTGYQYATGRTGGEADSFNNF